MSELWSQPEQLDNIRDAYEALCDKVNTVLRTQMGDAHRLGIQRSEVLALLHAAEIHREAFPIDEFAVLQQSVSDMVAALDNACHMSADPLDCPMVEVSYKVWTGKRGRPRIYIDPEALSYSLGLRGSSHLGGIFGCGSRTVHRRAIDEGIIIPGAPVYTTQELPDGSKIKIYNQQKQRSRFPEQSDAELDAHIFAILQNFPKMGRGKISAALEARGAAATRARIKASRIRVQGAPGVFGHRAIHRRKYFVPGANSLWHHDGQHGLIRWKIVQHGFIDGKSRFVVGIRASNNNRSETVLDVFLTAAEVNGFPSRVRGDHGTENVLVAQFMEECNGYGRGSYIWGRSVHNTRIERLWYDVTHDYGQKWKEFFTLLEVHHGLNPNLSSHVWLLHHLFLSAINEDAQEWANIWNEHKLQIRGERQRSPRDMFFFSLMQDGPRGVEFFSQVVNEQGEPQDIAQFGIDWSVMESHTFMTHWADQNPADAHDGNAFTDPVPVLSDVPCEPPTCPFNADEVLSLDQHLYQQFEGSLGSRDMGIRRLRWIIALNFSTQLYCQNYQ